MATPGPYTCAFTMMDVLGVKEKITSTDRQRVFESFMHASKEMIRVFDARPSGDTYDLIRSTDEKVLLFSDTLVFFKIVSNDVPACDALVSAATFATRVICECLEKEFLVRGAIAVGELFYNRDPEAIAGGVVNECAQHYELGDWVGCHLAPSAVEVIRQTPPDRRPRTNSRFAEYEMPVIAKSGEVMMSKQTGVRWLEYQADVLPGHAAALYPGKLKDDILAARSKGQDEGLAVKNYFLDLLRQYVTKNPIAKRKVAHTLRLYGSGNTLVH